MEKTNAPISNNFCPQTLFLYGTYKDNGTPNFGLFCWFSYVWNAELGVMACIGGDKLTKDLIRKNKTFSANLVTADLAPIADYYGTTDGYSPDKMQKTIATTPGQVLNVPIVDQSPVSFELEVTQEIPLDGSDVFICKIRNLLVDPALVAEDLDIHTQLDRIKPLITTAQTYFQADYHQLGKWGQLKKTIA
jgi:flavin reductase (DIM6/NTAB) family NADH-FMN oxidoreductase RutF